MTLLARKIIEDLWLKNRNFCSSDYEACLEYFKAILPFHIHEYHCEEHDQGWVIPPKWDLVKASIAFKGREIFCAMTPLQTINLSAPFKGRVPLDELKKHLHYDKRYSDAIPFHFRQNYRPWEREWGFCVTQTFYDSLQDGEYEVEINTRESEGYLRVAELIKKGESPYGFAFVAHLDHGGMANDDLAGVAVGLDLFQRLFPKKTKFTYRLILVQEIIGSFFYLKYHRDPNIIESCFMEMLGTSTQLALQASNKGNSYLEQTLENVLRKRNALYRQGAFREIISNDEVMWESMGVPMASLSRFPYPEYHCDKDNPSIIHDDALEEAISVFEETIDTLERSTLVCKHFMGVMGVSNPEYGLYVDPGQPAFKIRVDANQQKLRELMDLIPLISNRIFAEQLAEKVGLSREDTLSYLKLWQEKGLLTLI